MSRAAQDKAYTNFLAGFVTEASGLTFPPNSCRDIDNCDIELKGLVRRRLGLSQETEGATIGAGALAVTTYANNTGGPLSANPFTEAALVQSTYDGSATSDWTFGSSTNGEAGYDPDNGFPAPCFAFASTQGNYGYMNQDVNFSDFDLVTLKWESQEVTSNECPLSVGLGVDSGGIGSYIEIDRFGVSKCTYAGRTISDRANREVLWDGRNFESHTKVIVTLSKIDVNEWSVTIVSIDGGSNTIVNTSQTTIGSSSDYIEFRVNSGQSHTGRYRVDNIELELQAFENGGDTGLTTVPANQIAISKHVWSNVGGIDGKSWVVFQIGNRLYFRDQLKTPISTTGGTVPTSTSTLAFDGPGSGFVYNITAAEAAQVRLQSAVGNGRIWFTSKAVIPFYAEYDPIADQIILRPNGYQAAGETEEALTGARRIRDFNGVPDGLLNEEKPTTLTAQHGYNLLNQGWPADKINDYYDDKSVYPSNAQQWILGRDSGGDFDPDTLDKQEFGNSLAPRGRLIIDALLGEKDGVTHAIDGLDTPIDFDDAYDEKSTTGWATVGFFAGRVWYAGDSNLKRPNGIYFSKVLQSPRDSGTFMQENDPTSEHFSDLLATDGGVIYLPEADQILKLVPYASGIVVMARNGVWMVYGGEGGFTATNFSVEKISSTGIINADTAITTDQAIVFWADNGIHVLSLPQQGNIPVVQDVSATRIFQYYNEIDPVARQNATGAFDQVTKKVFWFWLEDSDGETINIYDKALIFDTRTTAFTKYSFAADLDTPFGVAGAFPHVGMVAPQAANILVVDDEPVTVDGEIVTIDVDYENIIALQTSLVFIVVDGVDEGLRLGLLNSRRFEDFINFENGALDHFTSYVITGHETLGDLQRYKQGTYLHSFFNRTEDSLIPQGDNFVLNNQSGCLVTACWDWHNTANGGRWSDSQEAYRYRRAYVAESYVDTVDNGEEIVYSKLKIRGKGRALSVKYESVPCKDFQLLGYSVAFTANGV